MMSMFLITFLCFIYIFEGHKFKTVIISLIYYGFDKILNLINFNFCLFEEGEYNMYSKKVCKGKYVITVYLMVTPHDNIESLNLKMV